MEAPIAGFSRLRWKNLVTSGTAAIALLAPSAPAQEVVRQWFGDSPGQGFGSPIGWVGDVNADGFMDIGVAAPLDSTVLRYGGMVRVISGKDGAVLHTFYGDGPSAELGSYGFGHPFGDLDRDGYDDVMVSEYGYYAYGKIIVFSGRDGSALLKLTGSSTLSISAVNCGLGDVDGDGVPDLAVTSASGNSALILSGATGATIHTLPASDPASRYFGHALLNPGDIDGDGVNDLIVSENSCRYPSQMNYYAFSGSTGATIWIAPWSTYCSGFSANIDTVLSPVVIGDIDGDGIPDWADGMNYTQYGSTGGFVYCHSGKDGSLIRYIHNPLGYGSRQGSSFGEAIAAAGDVNGDGVPDLAASDYWFCDDPGGDVYFFSGVDGTMLFHSRGTTSAKSFGNALVGGLDPDGDSKLDMIVGDTADSSNGPSAGAVTQLRLEPLILDFFPHFFGYGYFGVLLDGGIPGNPVAIFLADVNGTSLFDLVEVDTINSSRFLKEYWNAPYGLSGITAKFVAISIGANGRLLVSNYQTISFL